MRLCAGLILMLGLLTAAPLATEFDVRMERFHKHWDKFARDYWGCPPGAKDRADCNATLSVVDRKEFHAACMEARAMFGLEGKCE